MAKKRKKEIYKLVFGLHESVHNTHSIRLVVKFKVNQSVYFNMTGRKNKIKYNNKMNRNTCKH